MDLAEPAGAAAIARLNCGVIEHGRIVIAGGTGFIGSALARHFYRAGHDVVVLTRSLRERFDGVRETLWDGVHIGEWIQEFEGAQAVINLAGQSINCPHTPENLQAIHASRMNSVYAIAAALRQAKERPAVWVQASAVGYYGDTGDAICVESAPAGAGDLAKICVDWEGLTNAADRPLIRKVALRIGFVLGRDGGALPVLATLARMFLGGAAGTGQQYISWIHLDDLVRLFATVIPDEKFSGAYNAVTPNPVTNAEFMRELRRALHRPWSPPVPELAVKFGARLMKGEPSLALASSRCFPKRFTDAGFKFNFPDLGPALRDLCR